MSSLRDVSENDFVDEVELSDRPVIVDFWAEWCGPCKQLAPRLEKLSEQYPDVKIVKVDVDDNPDVTQRFGVRSIPTLIFFKEGENVHELTGAVDPSTLSETIEDVFEADVLTG